MNAPPTLRPFNVCMLDAGDGHWIFVEEVGTKGGRPCLFLHGGPGSGAQHFHRSLFDPARDHVFLFDQRGAGRSHPYLSCAANTTQHLVADIERIREFFGIERWLVTGGSWGSTLALAYAQAHPGRVSALILRALFLGTKAEVAWAFDTGPATFRPELHAAFRDWLPEKERGDLIAAYVRRLTDPDPAVHAPAAHIWNSYERALSLLSPGLTELSVPSAPNVRLPPTPILEAHYIAHDFFLAPGQLLEGARHLADIPGVIVQGRYDLLCPPANAFALAQRWPCCKIEFAETAGHAISETGIADGVRAAIARL